MGEEIYKAKFTADTTELTKAAKDAESKLSKFTSSIDKFSRKLIVSGAAITAGMGAIIAKTVSAAASVEELQNRTMVTFRESAGMVQKWAATYAEAIGRSRFAMEEQATQLGVLLSAFGLSGKAVAENAVALGKLTSDWESFMNIPASEVLAKIASGLAGEAEALRRLGVDVSAVAVKQELLNRGYQGSIENATQLEKVQARLAIILRGLPDAQGDAARTAGELVNQWRALQGALRDLNVGLGQIFAKDAKTAIGALADLIRGSTSWLTANKELVGSIASTTVKIGTFALVIGGAGLALTKFIAGARGIIAGAKALRAFGLVVGSTGSKLGSAGLVVAVGAASAAIGNWIGRVTGAHDAIESFALSLSEAWGDMKDFRDIVADVDDKLKHVTAGLQKGWAEQEKFNKAARDGTISWKEYQAWVVRVAKGLLTAKEAIAAINRELRDSTVDVSATIAGYVSALAALEKQLGALKEQYASLETQQDAFAQSVSEMADELQLEQIFTPEVFEAQFETIRDEIRGLLPEVAAGNAEATEQIRAALARLTESGQEYAMLMGEAAGEAESARWMMAADAEGAAQQAEAEALAGLRAYVEETGKAVATALGAAQEQVGDDTVSIEQELAALEERFQSLAEYADNIPVTVDTAELHKEMDAIEQRFKDLRAEAWVTFGGFAGFGGGTPGEDRLSIARRPKHPGRSESITTNINAPINIARGGTPSSLAKSVASEIGRMKRRGHRVG